ncbi:MULTISPECIES: helix-turn-helix domain-containing protein [Paraburkholderia]|uniref:helix-turn-helix domain-containing protein n=1 Tax=Paraburkholderia TaxID=1822464 RepID=UPI002256EF59|nr:MULTISPECIES: AraC family transcriptional regulator [Paraburkholderia]MCX4173724.1 AraC family transcriptional regulator [Paraburkholderia madseniana]MDQ6461729.1 AraC family transcriptional regulator [Paraburkholderia madseniana]
MHKIDGAKWKSYADYFKVAAYSEFPQEHRSSPGRMQCKMVQTDLGPHNYCDPDVPDLVISSHLEMLNPGETSWNFGSGWSRGVWTPGSIFAMPPNIQSDWRAECARRALLLIVPTGTLKRVFGPSTPVDLQEAFIPLSQDIWSDPFLQSLMIKLWEASQHYRHTDYLLADGLLITILSVLLQRAGVSDRPDKIALSPRKLKRVSEFVEEKMQEKIDVLDMATVAGLSSRHFGRAFTQEVGVTPHRWLMQKRVNRAKDLLLRSELDCLSIAERCGFASQSHLTVAMKKQIGITPSEWRQLNASIQI